MPRCSFTKKHFSLTKVFIEKMKKFEEKGEKVNAKKYLNTEFHKIKNSEDFIEMLKAEYSEEPDDYSDLDKFTIYVSNFFYKKEEEMVGQRYAYNTKLVWSDLLDSKELLLW